MTTSVFTNRLSHETSPYLKQHAHNPVDWYPWGPEALERARQLDRPVFLSIGYSACHWCHVMEHESFENEEIAGIHNEHFISIKVDREERPDLDQIYMTSVQLLNNGQGGWPMSVFLTPDLAVQRRHVLSARGPLRPARLQARAADHRRLVEDAARRPQRGGRRDHRAHPH